MSKLLDILKAGGKVIGSNLASYCGYDSNVKVPEQEEACSLAALYAFANTPNEARGISVEKSLEEITKNIVLVKIVDKNKEDLYNGSGLMITTDGYVITAYHVVEDIPPNGKIIIKTGEKKEYIVSRQNGIWYNRNTDLAILKAKKHSLHPTPIKALVDRKDALKKGCEVNVIGYRDGHVRNSIGIITASRLRCKFKGSDYKIHDLFETDVRGKCGQSGGAIINANGELVGIVIYAFGKINKELGWIGGARISNALKYVNQIVAEKSSVMFSHKNNADAVATDLRHAVDTFKDILKEKK